MMKIRIAETNDIEKILSVLESGREFLHSQGLSQWQNGYGPIQHVEEDIANNWGYVLLSHNSICGYAALVEGVDECYTNIKDGCWDTSYEKYISIHSVAIDANFRGKKLAVPFIRGLIEIAESMDYHDIRIDTHPLNEIMQKVILQSGFVYKGIVEFNIPDGKRKGYQLIKTKLEEQQMSKLPVALQIYTVRDYAEKDFKGTMKQLKEIGYDYVELAGLYGLCPCKIKSALDEAGLKAISAHVPLNELVEDTDNTIDNYIKIGCEYIAVPYLGEGLRPGEDGFKQVLADIKMVGKKCYEKGVTLLYHNHDFEFVKLDNGEYGLDDMYANVEPDYLQTEIDTCWVNVAGVNPSDYIRKYSGRSPVVHLKDFAGQKSDNMYELIGIDKKVEQTEEFAFKPVGYGVQDFPSILAASIDAGAKYVVVEQDRSDDCTPLEAAKKSRDYLKTLGW